MKISVVIPCFNEVNTISEIIKRIDKALNKYQFEVLVIDDFSSDGSVEVLEKIKMNYKNVRVFFNSKNLGKGASLRKGFDDREIICISAILNTSNDLIHMIGLIVSSSADVVIGSRFRAMGLSELIYS